MNDKPDIMHGFFSAIKAKLKAERAEMSDGSFAIILADQRSAREDFLAEKLGKIPPVRPIRSVSLVTNRPGAALASLQAGYREGLNTQLRPAIGREQKEFVLS